MVFVSRPICLTFVLTLFHRIDMFKYCLKFFQILLLCTVLCIPLSAQEQLNKLVILKKGMLIYIENKPEVPADFTLPIPKQKFIEGIAEREKLRAIVLGKDVQREGNIFKLPELLEDIEKFDPNWNIIIT
jgi:alkyl sulfatase BDS1-like metallo-beta-lactamase superfamily hydrolase